MSTIACDGQILAVDMRNIIGGTIHNIPSQNIYVLNDSSDPPNYVVMVCIGDKHQIAFFVEHFATIRTSKTIAEFKAVYGEARFTAYVYFSADNAASIYQGIQYLTEANVDLSSIGSGSSYALGALEAGADAISAIKIASRYDLLTDGKNIQYVDLTKPYFEVQHVAYQ